jgi:hypothetical protein
MVVVAWFFAECNEELEKERRIKEEDTGTS